MATEVAMHRVVSITYKTRSYVDGNPPAFWTTTFTLTDVNGDVLEVKAFTDDESFPINQND
jgi:hypothetical protein